MNASTAVDHPPDPTPPTSDAAPDGSHWSRPRPKGDGSPSRRSWRERLVRPVVIVPVVAVLLLVGAGGWWLSSRSSGTTATVTTTRQLVAVSTGAMNETVSAEGTVAAAQTDDLSFSSSGTVTAVNIAAGDTVVAGQVLATIDSAELQAAVTKAEATVADAEAKLSDDQDAGASSAQLEADRSSVTSAEDTLATAQEALAGASLVATFDGTVAAVNITVGQELGSGGSGATTPTGSNSGSGGSSANLGASGAIGGTGSSDSSSAQIQVVSTGSFTVELAVDSADIDRLAVGQSATLTVSSSSSSSGAFPNFPGGFAPGGGGADLAGGGRNGSAAGQTATANAGSTATGTVTEVGKVADASSGVATYPVTVSFSAPADQFYVGSTVTADVATNVVADAIQVPSAAVTTTNAGSTVLVSTDGTTDSTETRTVTTGLTANGMTQITSGLTAGEQVVVERGGFGGPGGGATGGAPTGGFSPPAGLPPGAAPASNGAGG